MFTSFVLQLAARENMLFILVIPNVFALLFLKCRHQGLWKYRNEQDLSRYKDPHIKNTYAEPYSFFLGENLRAVFINIFTKDYKERVIAIAFLRINTT